MAKYNRHDTKNKKRNKHKNFSKDGGAMKFHRVESELWKKSTPKKIFRRHQVDLEGI